VNQLTRFAIKNFKSLVDFDLHFARDFPVTCLVGLNGSGKSTVLQAIDFAGQLMRGDIAGWLQERNWDKMDLLAKRPRRFGASFHSAKSRVVELRVEITIDHDSRFIWSSLYNPVFMRCTYETLEFNGVEIFSLQGKKYSLGGASQSDIVFNYEGSILSQIDDKILQLHPQLLAFKKFVKGIHSFDMLSPHRLKQRAREGKNIGMSGGRLSAFLHGLPPNKQNEVMQVIRSFYPWISTYRTSSVRFGWKALEISEQNGLSIDSKHANDGTLRLLAILAELHTEDTIVLFDEIENGLNPKIMGKLINLLTTSPVQIVVTTHNPVLLNFLPEEKVEESVILIYRNESGSSFAKRYFDLPAVLERLPFLSPGEIFLDVDIENSLRDLSTLQEDSNSLEVNTFSKKQ